MYMMNIMDRWMNKIDRYDGYDKCTDKLIDMMNRYIDMKNMKVNHERYTQIDMIYMIDMIDIKDRQI